MANVKSPLVASESLHLGLARESASVVPSERLGVVAEGGGCGRSERSGALGSVGSSRLGFPHAVALAFGGDDDGVVEEPVEHRRGGGVLG
jgi:hypothetical protein